MKPLLSYRNCLHLNQLDRTRKAATWEFEEDNGAATGTPGKGTTRTAARAEVYWKNIDDSTTAYSSNPITAGNNSFDKWQFGHFSGSYNQILSGLFAHTLTTFGTGLTLKGPPAAPNTYVFTITSGNATVGATFTNNSQTFTISQTIASQTTLVATGTGAPTASGTLTKTGGTGDATITFSAFTQNGLAYTTPATTANANLTTDMTTAITIGSGVAVWFGATGPEAGGKATSTTANPAYTTWLTTQLQTTGSAAAGDCAQVTISIQYNEN